MSTLLIIYSLFSLLLALAYAYIMWQYTRGWQELKIWELPKNFVGSTKMSILIPARNEAENIGACIESILNQNYPCDLYEIIVLDDHSEDETPDWVRLFQVQCTNVRLLHLADFVQEGETQSFKKKAIEIGIQHATGDLIVTTDGDCVVQPQWLSLLASFYEAKNWKFIAAPVNFYKEKNALERFQSLDFMGMMGVAGAGIQRDFMRMCNGANLAYQKSVFYEVNGFEGINELASGDDMLLMQKVAERYPNGIGYLKNQAATTFTEAKPTLRSFLNQRIRWSTKSGSYRESMVTAILATVFFFCCNIFLSLFLLPIFGVWVLLIFLFSLLIKAAMDYWFLNTTSQFFHKQDLMQSFMPSFFMHTAYIVVVGFLANIKTTYEWKGRQVK